MSCVERFRGGDPAALALARPLRPLPEAMPGCWPGAITPGVACCSRHAGRAGSQTWGLVARVVKNAKCQCVGQAGPDRPTNRCRLGNRQGDPAAVPHLSKRQLDLNLGALTKRADKTKASRTNGRPTRWPASPLAGRSARWRAGPVQIQLDGRPTRWRAEPLVGRPDGSV